jgi:hypothetical protein
MYYSGGTEENHEKPQSEQPVNKKMFVKTEACLCAHKQSELPPLGYK